ncbi:MAG TPA: TauD/TfdA family dioxygenase [Terriglobales bacterium]|nr:TauD/TfdA family dioxygenase [Terriglobales bacterium]
MARHLSFEEQALHYLVRPHEQVPAGPIAGPVAWRRDDFDDERAWTLELSASSVAELEAAHDHARARGVTLRELRTEDFPLPQLAAQIAAWRDELLCGRGFLVVRGIPVADWGEEKSSFIYWGIGLHLGRPGAQNAQEDLLGHVIAAGEDAENVYVRRYRTAGDIAYHCDLADAVGLLCLQTARSGGASRIVSSVSVFNVLQQRRPDLAARLFEPVLIDRRDEAGSGPAYVPVFPCRYAGGQLRTFYHSDYFRSVVRHPDVPPFTPEQQALFDTYEEIASSPELCLEMQFRRGDLQLVSNHLVLHARTAYEDYPDAARKRHLLRLWLSLT